MNLQELMLKHLEKVNHIINEEFLKETVFYTMAESYTTESFERTVKYTTTKKMVNSFLNLKRRTSFDNCNDLFDIALAYLIFNSEILKSRAESGLEKNSELDIIKMIKNERSNICSYDSDTFSLFKTRNGLLSDQLASFLNSIKEEDCLDNLDKDIDNHVQSALLYIVNAAQLELLESMTNKQKSAILLGATTTTREFFDLRYANSFLGIPQEESLYSRFFSFIEGSENFIIEDVASMSLISIDKINLTHRFKELLIKLYASEFTHNLGDRYIRNSRESVGQSSYFMYDKSAFANIFSDEVSLVFSGLTRQFSITERTYQANRYQIPSRDEILKVRAIIETNPILFKEAGVVFGQELLEKMLDVVEETGGKISKEVALSFGEENFTLEKSTPGALALMFYINIPVSNSCFSERIAECVYENMKKEIADKMAENFYQGLKRIDEGRKAAGKETLLFPGFLMMTKGAF